MIDATANDEVGIMVFAGAGSGMATSAWEREIERDRRDVLELERLSFAQ